MDQPVVIPQWNCTGKVCGITEALVSVLLDAGQGRIDDCPIGECYSLRWHDRDVRGSFIYIAKAWISRSDFYKKEGRRVLRVQAHRITNGTLGRRRIVAEYVNGKPVRGR